MIKIVLLTLLWLFLVFIISILLNKLWDIFDTKDYTNCYYVNKGCPYWHKCYRNGKPNFREKMNIPIIDPSTLTEEQRDRILNMYSECLKYEDIIDKQINHEKITEEKARNIFYLGMNYGGRMNLHALFGNEFFEKEE